MCPIQTLVIGGIKRLTACGTLLLKQSQGYSAYMIDAYIKGIVSAKSGRDEPSRTHSYRTHCLEIRVYARLVWGIPHRDLERLRMGIHQQLIARKGH